ncbi:type II toxin-antitoxin system VapC family toxin [Caulobacter hibisci]|uniref:type II toxin-antitoxin system VapC family toxin n=1 Tax=Caulobacter hibisci TaxID=2035993 RepID=UPI001E2A2FBE|nr:type II toxin-antitoxin system VapC family toxin [Caulobacter hibisci]
MIVVDTSALAAIVLRESERETFLSILIAQPRKAMSAASVVEAAHVYAKVFAAEIVPSELDRDLQMLGIEIIDVDPAQARLAIDAAMRFGKGRHPARLNLGDCFSYALAKALNAPLLFKGDDFAHTDIRAAL